ncbi:MAG: alkyl hydroperoxide reductase [Marinilabiliales bacterium]|nr:MAG: alkyl hydroperoxide reductase [Marinilabiliales bacterium]
MKIRISHVAKLSLILLFTLQTFTCFAQEVSINIHLRGVAESKISLLALSGGGTFVSIIEMPGIKNGETTTFSVPAKNLPGEFVLRFDYKEKESSTPYPSEKYIFINDQDLELWVSPIYCNNADSTYFQANERENAAFVKFSNENAKQKQQLGLLQNFLINYDDKESKFYQQGIIEYEQRRQTFNQWLSDQTLEDEDLFVSSMYGFQYMPQIDFKGDESDIIKNLIDHYFDGIDFNNPFLIKTSDINKWMDNYVNLYSELAINIVIRDSLLYEAGRTAIEKAKKGHPLVYGWMVDYFNRGYESNGMDAGMKVLEPYLNDSTCLTSKRQAIEKRLAGIKTLKVGTFAPDFTLKDDAGNEVLFSKYKTNNRYKLLLFWSADCGHCKDLTNELYLWWQQLDDKTLVEVFALSLDDTETEITIWKNTIKQLLGWKHLRCKGGVNSPEANAYFILSTPVMFLVDARTNKIFAIPENVQQLSEQISTN